MDAPIPAEELERTFQHRRIADPAEIDLDRALVRVAHDAVAGAVRPHRPTVSVVVPTLNEALNLPFVLPQVAAHADEIVLVDGHSTDDTLAVAVALCPNVRVVLAPSRGKGVALQAGFAASSGDVIVMLDADGSNDPNEIPRFVGALVSGADFAKGSRFLQGGGTADMPHYRRGGNRLFVWLVRLLFGSRYSDLCYGYNGFWRDSMDVLMLDATGFEVETMMNIRALRAGLRVVEVPSYEALRIHGTSNLQTIRDGWRVLKTIFAERFLDRSSRRAPEPHFDEVIPAAPDA